MNRTVVLMLSFAALLGSSRMVAAQTATLDQQQAVIDTQAGLVLAIGAQGQQRLAQVVTAGRSGTLKSVALAIACASQIQLILEIQAVSGQKPNGTVLASQTFDNVGPYLDPPTFKTLELQSPLYFNAGDQFAIVMSSTPPNTDFICSTYPGPVGNPYPGGDAFVNSISDPPGQWTLLTAPWLGADAPYGADLPFQTFVAFTPIAPIPTLSVWGLTGVVALLALIGARNVRGRV